MDYFYYDKEKLCVESVQIDEIAKTFDTPLYIYSRNAIETNFLKYKAPLEKYDHRICYAVKANSNLAVLNVLARLGANFDIVSVGELERVLTAGGKPSNVVFSGVGKTRSEIRRALEVGIYCFNVESDFELHLVQEIAESISKTASISIRVNPDVDAETHPYISTGLNTNKFGVDINLALGLYQKAKSMKNIRIIGIDCHIGSQLTSKEPLLDALDRLLLLVDNLKDAGIEIEHLDIGGGLGICYKNERPPTPNEYIMDILERLKGRDLTLVLEPGRSIVAQAGILVAKVEVLKVTDHKAFAVVDAAMNDLLRPSIYGSWHDIIPVNQSTNDRKSRIYDIVGPICETGDFLGKDRTLCIKEGDLLAVLSAGAYGFVMSSNYNSRNRPAEVMVDKDQVHLVRRRETIRDQMASEAIPPPSPPPLPQPISIRQSEKISIMMK